MRCQCRQLVSVVAPKISQQHGKCTAPRVGTVVQIIKVKGRAAERKRTTPPLQTLPGLQRGGGGVQAELFGVDRWCRFVVEGVNLECSLLLCGSRLTPLVGHHCCEQLWALV